MPRPGKKASFFPKFTIDSDCQIFFELDEYDGHPRDHGNKEETGATM